MDELDREADRLRRVYAHYDRVPREQRKRDAANPGAVAMAAERATIFRQLLDGHFGPRLNSCRVLDLGCGRGDLLGWLHELGLPARNLLGIDILPDRIEAAQSLHPNLSFAVANAAAVAVADASFDLITCWLLFSSVLNRMIVDRLRGEVDRLLVPGGVVGWYDLRYPSPMNRNVRRMSRRRIKRLFPDYQTHLTSVTVLPPLARRLGSGTPQLYRSLGTLPPLRSHYIGLLIKGA